MSAVNYETFVIGAFKLAGYDDKVREKGDDPAGITNIDAYKMANASEYFYKVKAGLVYAIAVYNYQYSEIIVSEDSEEHDKMVGFLEKSLRVSNIWEIENLIVKYNTFKKHLDNLNENSYN